MRWLAAAIVIATGCAGETRWMKPGATTDQFAQDKWDCAVRAKYLNDNHTWSRGYTQGRLWRECMQDHGWREE